MYSRTVPLKKHNIYYYLLDSLSRLCSQKKIRIQLVSLEPLKAASFLPVLTLTHNNQAAVAPAVPKMYGAGQLATSLNMTPVPAYSAGPKVPVAGQLATSLNMTPVPAYSAGPKVPFAGQLAASVSKTTPTAPTDENCLDLASSIESRGGKQATFKLSGLVEGEAACLALSGLIYLDSGSHLVFKSSEYKNSKNLFNQKILKILIILNVKTYF